MADSMGVVSSGLGQELPILVQQHRQLGVLDGALVRRDQVLDGSPLRLHRQRLVGRREEAVGEVLQSARGDRRGFGVEQDVAGQIPVLASQRVGDPGTQAGVPPDVAAGVEQDVAARVQREVGDHGANDRQIVHAGGDVGKELADRDSRPAVFPEGPGTTLVGADAVAGGLAVQLIELGFGIERVHVGDAARHEAEDDVLDLGFVMGGRRRDQAGVGVLGHEGGQGGQSEPVGAQRQHLSPRERSAEATGTNASFLVSLGHDVTSSR